MAAMAHHVTFPAHERLIDEGTMARKFWLIDAGQVVLDTMVSGKGLVTIEMVGRGELLGLSAFQPPYIWQYGALTTQPMQAFEFAAAEVRAACLADPALGFELLSRVLEVSLHRLQAVRSRLPGGRSVA